ncbi:MAG: FAD-binding oxidoreductase [Gaiellales bacterium]
MGISGSAEVVVIGGGIMGASTLYYLTRNGCTDAVLVERDTLGAGSTGKAAGGIRAQFSDELNVRLGLESIRRYEQFGDEPGGEIDFKQWGYLFLLTNRADVDAFAAGVALQQAHGVPSRLLTADEAHAIVPGVNVEDVLAATFCPIDGYATPEAAVQGYASAASQAGATIVQGCAAERIVIEDGRVAAVETRHGRIATRRVVLTAGVWSGDLGRTAGVEIPVEAEPRHVFFTGPGDPLPHELPLTIDFATGFYFHRERPGLLVGGRARTLEALAPAAVHRLPALADVPFRGGWWGYYELSPDHNAIVGRTPDPDGLVYATGFSGHGFQQGPVVGEHAALLALDRPTPFDLRPFSLDRFASGATRPERNVV